MSGTGNFPDNALHDNEEHGDRVQGLIRALESNDRNIRKRAVQDLGETGDERAVRPLVALLPENQQGDREFLTPVESSITQICTSNIPCLIRMLAGPDLAARDMAVSIIATTFNLQDPASSQKSLPRYAACGVPEAEPLIAALKDPDDRVRKGAVLLLGFALSGFTEKEAVARIAEAPLITALDDPSPEVRGSAARVLSFIRTPRTRNVLIAALRHSDQNVGAAAAHGLGAWRTDSCIVEPLIRELSSGSGKIRKEAAFILGLTGDPRAVAPLIAVLREPGSDPSSRAGAAEALGRLQAKEACDALIGSLADMSPEVRKWAAAGLGEIRDRRAVGSLIRLLDDPDRSVVCMAAGSLIFLRDCDSGESQNDPSGSGQVDIQGPAPFIRAGFTDPRVMQSLSGLLNDPDNQIRENAASLLGLTWDPAAIDPLISALNDPDCRVRAAAVRSLCPFRHAAARDSFIAALSDADEDVRRAVASALVDIIHESGVKESLVIACRDPDAKVRAGAIYVLGLPGDPAFLDLLLGSSRDPDPEVRAQAASGLGFIRDTRSASALTVLLKDSDSGVVRAALQAAANHRDPCLVEPLLALISQQKPDFRREAVFDLGVIGEPLAISRLIELACDKDWMFRKEIVIALVNNGDGQNYRILFQSLSDPVSNVRAVATAALGNLREKVRGPAAEKLLVTLVNDTESEVRLRAAYALGSFRNRESIQPLTVLLNDDSPDVRIAAAEALGHIGDAGAVGSLTGRLKDTDRNVRYSVATALGMIGDDRAVQPLTLLLDDDFDSVRDAAAGAIARIHGDSNDKSRDEPDDGRPGKHW